LICRSTLYGEGVFETFRCFHGLPVFLRKHFERMKMGAKLLRIPTPGWREFKQTVKEKIDVSADLRVKVCLFSFGSQVFDEKPKESELVCFISRYERPRKPLRLHLVSFPRNSKSPVVRIKSLNYLENVLGRREAKEMGFDEGLFLNERGEVAECCASNIFWMKDEVIYTPDESCGLLPGITRELVLSLAPKLGFKVKEGRYGLKNLLESDCVFLTNSLIGAHRVEEIEGFKIRGKNKNFAELQLEIFRTLKWLP